MWFDSGPFDRLRAGPFGRLRAGSSTDSGPAHHERGIRVRGLGLVGRSGWHWCAGIVGCRWVPHSTSSGQALRGCRDVVRLGPPKTAGRLTMNGNGLGLGGREAGGWARFGMCSVGRANVFSFLPNVFGFRRNVFTLAGQVFTFGWGASPRF